MYLNDTARVRHPRTDFEQRLATITAVEPQPGQQPGDWYQLRFPHGQTRWYLPDSIHLRTRDDERRCLLDALTAARAALRHAVHLAQDYDASIAVDLDLLAIELDATVRYRLDVPLGDPDDHSDPNPSEEGVR